MRTVAIVQARMGSSRLPGKTLIDLAGSPMLARVIQRLERAAKFHDIVVATTVLPSDDLLEELCRKRGWACFRGDDQDVLDRYYHAALRFSADVIVRITGDCPLIDPDVVDRVVREFEGRQPGLDYASNVLSHRTFPRGFDTEVFRFDALERAWSEDHNSQWREHVTPFIYRHPDIFSLHAVLNDIDYSSIRLTVDTKEDLTLVKKIYDHFREDCFSWHDIRALLVANPDWLRINRDVKQTVV